MVMDGTLIVEAVEAGTAAHPLFAHWQEMVAAYGRLLRDQVADAAQWQAVHRMQPVAAMAALVAAAQSVESSYLALALYRLTETPAQLFVRLGDGCAFDGQARTAVFRAAESAELFRQRFPDWSILHLGGEP